MDLCHLKNAELEPKFQKYKGRVVLRSDIVEYECGAFAVFTEQGSSASQITAAKVMDVIELPNCVGQAADAISAYTQVKMKDATTLLRIPKSECSDVKIRIPRHSEPRHVTRRKSQRRNAANAAQQLPLDRLLLSSRELQVRFPAGDHCAEF